jgi:hypothetical protein
MVKLQEQMAVHTYKRASLTPEELAARQNSSHGTGHYAGLHQDKPITTTNHNSRPPVQRQPAQRTQADEDNTFYPRSSTSTRRYTNLPQTRTGQVQTQIQEVKQRQRILFHPSVVIGAIVCSMVLAIFGAVVIPSTFQKWRDDSIYGYPRITRAVADVGHGNAVHPLSRFIGINLDGTIEVIEFPAVGDNPSQHPANIYIVTRLSTLSGDVSTIPVTSITFTNGVNGKPEMDVVVNATEYIFSNDGKTFKEQ